MTDTVTTRSILTEDDVAITVHRVGSHDGTPVILAPGTFSNWSFWLGTRGTGFARELARRGFEAWVVDLRGHGRSQRPAPGERWNFDDWGRLDLPAVIRAAHDEGRTPLLVGHSAGGASVLAALAGTGGLESGVAAAAIIATPLPWLQRWRRAGAWAMRFASRHMDAFPARLLGLGPEDELPGVMEQWMDWNLRGRWIGRDGTDYSTALTRLRLPLLFIAGSGDRRFAPPAACRGLFDLAGSPDRLFIEAGIDTGFSRDYGHADLIVSRDARREIWPLLADWLAAHAPPSA
ncbi:MAG TPA: alpha/beta fold hydrolase [Longimicrobiales bacterium]|nr:alpha/beta fold hydrolase [Longimicrobiales bacterium]